MKLSNTWQAFSTVTLACLLLVAGAVVREYGFEGIDKGIVRYPTLTQLMQIGQANKASDDLIKRLASQKQLLEDSLSVVNSDKAHAVIPTDTIAANFVTNPVQADGSYGLDKFFEALHSGHYLRVAHFGDSQIEGDRITSFIRDNFQRHFGGTGLGYLPLLDPAVHRLCTRKHSENWIRYNIFSKKTGNGFYGLSGNTFRYQPVVEEQEWPALIEAGKKLTAWVSFSFASGVTYDKVFLHWGRSPVPLTLKIYLEDTVAIVDSLPPTLDYTITPLPIPPNAEFVKLVFESTGVAPDIYGLSFDGDKGVQVDNYAIRGHSGDGIASINSDYLATQLTLTGTKLIIFQYGGNVVPMTQIHDFSFFEADVYKMLMRFKKIAPDVNLLVISTADQAHKTDDGWVTYHTVEKIRNAQLRAAQRAGVAFWDLYAVMGGQNSIVTWVNQDPPLAAKDYAHFVYHGQKLIGRLLFNAIMKEYKFWLQRTNQIKRIDNLLTGPRRR